MPYPANGLLLVSGIRYLLGHGWQALLTLVGVTLGVAIVLAVDLANNAARDAFAQSASQLRGAATHRLINPAGDVPASLYRTLFTTPGAPPMAPLITQRVRVTDQPGRYRLVGLDPFAEAGFRTALGGALQGQSQLGEWLSRPGATALSSAAAAALQVSVGDRVDVQLRGGNHTLHVIAVHDDDSSAGRDMLLVDIATAEAVSGMQGALTHIDLRLDDQQVAWIAQRLPPAVTLVDVDTQMQGIAGMSAAFELNLTAMSLLALLVGMFLIFNAMSFTIVQRHDLLGRLRALGVTARQLFMLTLAEALLLALVGTLLGCLLGIALGRGLTGVVGGTIDMLYYDTNIVDMPVTAFALAKASLLGIAGTLAAAWLPAHQAAATPPLSSLSRSSLESQMRRRIPQVGLLGVLLAGTGLVTALAVPGGVLIGFAGLFVLLLGAALLMPLLLSLGGRLLGGLPLTRTLRMAVRDLNRHLSRLSTATAALMVALAASIGVAVMVESMRGSVENWLDRALLADLYVSGVDYADDTMLPAGTDVLAAALPGVVALSRYSNHRVLIGARPVELVGADLAARSRVGFEFIAEIDDPWGAFDRGEVLISEPLARRLDLSAGDPIRLPTATGDRAFRVAAVFRDFASEHGRLFVDLDRFRSHWPKRGLNTLALFADSIDAAVLHERARQRLSAAADVELIAAREIYVESMRVFDRTFRITEVLRYLALLVAVVGILSALMAIQLERRREYAVLRAIGFTRRQLSVLILSQSLVLGLIAGLAAVPTGLAMAWILTDAIQLRAFGWSMQFLISPGPLLLSLALGAAAALLAGLYPAWQSSRQPPAAQLRGD